MGKRLNKQDWLAAGLNALQQDGPGALAAEPMARRLGNTKGSFYWHFADVPAYHTALIGAWRGQALRSLAVAVSTEQAADHRLRHFGYEILSDPTETAMRVWAHRNPQVARAVSDVDAERHTYFALLLREVGLANPDFARAVQAALVGLPQMVANDKPAQWTAFDTLVDTVLALSD